MNQLSQLSLLDWQPPPELMVAPQSKVLTICENLLPQPAAINQHSVVWQEGNIAYYRKLMLRFMELGRSDAEAGKTDLQKQAMRRHMISDLHSRCKDCLAKLEQLQGGTDATT